MTRINVVPVEELSDQWLLAEYHELPRCIKQKINIEDAPSTYKLGPGHMKWAASHLAFLMQRYYFLCNEMKYRGFRVNYPSSDLNQYVYENKLQRLVEEDGYKVTPEDIELNKQRLLEKYLEKPGYYKWTKRKKPEYYHVFFRFLNDILNIFDKNRKCN